MTSLLPRLTAQWVRHRTDYSPRTSTAVRRCVADALACAAAGVRAPTYAKVARVVEPLWGGPGSVSLWYRGRGTTLLAAAYLNSTAVGADDLDDGHRGAIGHPGGAIVPAALAYAEAEAPDRDLTAPIAFGYDVATTLAAGRTAARLPTMATGRWAAYGVAAALWALTDAPTQVLTDALAHAGSLSPQLVHPSAATPDGLKEGTAWATAAGITAFHLALAGVGAPTHVLDHHPDYDEGWFATAPEGPAVERAYFKRYACCRWIHPALDLLYRLKADGELPAPDRIRAIEIDTFARSLTLPNDPCPTTLEAAHYSFPFCVALAVHADARALLPLTANSLLDDGVRRTARQVRLRESPDLTARFPERTPVRLTITTDDRSWTLSLPTALGDPTVPLPDDFLPAKHGHLLRDHPAVRRELADLLSTEQPVTVRGLATLLTTAPCSPS
ncbi:MmgE/PrpD family protein [Cryptosporangium sp. NPDC051539]|uniref:MmgE/PrpD family protein n=1 Tax=Cryptosporangium sp. NPDC051539 TaxID=3363962 RepID=UPI0037B0B872